MRFGVKVFLFGVLAGGLVCVPRAFSQGESQQPPSSQQPDQNDKKAAKQAAKQRSNAACRTSAVAIALARLEAGTACIMWLRQIRSADLALAIAGAVVIGRSVGVQAAIAT